MTGYVDIVKGISQHHAPAKHIRLTHINEDAEFVTKCVKGGISFNLNRFILESLEIEEAKIDSHVTLMNSRSEWGGRGIPRISITH